MGPLFHLATKSSMASNNYQFDLNQIPNIEGVNEIQSNDQNKEPDEERQGAIPLVVQSSVDGNLVLDFNTDGNHHYPLFDLNVDYLQQDANDDSDMEDTDSILSGGEDTDSVLNTSEDTDSVLNAGDDTDSVLNAGTLFYCSFAFKLRTHINCVVKAHLLKHAFVIEIDMLNIMFLLKYSISFFFGQNLICLFKAYLLMIVRT